MNYSTSEEQVTSVPSLSTNDEIDLRQVAGALSRHRKLIAGIAGGSLILSNLYAFT